MPGSAFYATHLDGNVNNQKINTVFEHIIDWLDDDPAGSIPPVTINSNAATGGHIVAIDMVFGETPPNSIAVTVANRHGVTIFSGVASASGRLDLESPVPFVGPLVVTLSQNVVASANGKTIVTVI